MNPWFYLICQQSWAILFQQKQIWSSLPFSLLYAFNLIISLYASAILLQNTLILFFLWQSIFFIIYIFYSFLFYCRNLIISSLAFLNPASPSFIHAYAIILSYLSTALWSRYIRAGSLPISVRLQWLVSLTTGLSNRYKHLICWMRSKNLSSAVILLEERSREVRVQEQRPKWMRLSKSDRQFLVRDTVWRCSKSDSPSITKILLLERSNILNMERGERFSILLIMLFCRKRFQRRWRWERFSILVMTLFSKYKLFKLTYYSSPSIFQITLQWRYNFLFISGYSYKPSCLHIFIRLPLFRMRLPFSLRQSTPGAFKGDILFCVCVCIKLQFIYFQIIKGQGRIEQIYVCINVFMYRFMILMILFVSISLFISSPQQVLSTPMSVFAYMIQQASTELPQLVKQFEHTLIHIGLDKPELHCGKFH